MLPQVNYLLANASLDIDANFYPPGPEEIRRASVMEAPQNTVGGTRPIKYTSHISAHHSRSVPLSTLLI